MAFVRFLRRSYSSITYIPKFNFKNIGVFCEEDCAFYNKKSKLTSDASCVHGKPAVGWELRCYCNRYRAGKRKELSLSSDNTSYMEMEGCVEAAKSFEANFRGLKAVLVCDNEGVSKIVKRGYSVDPATDELVQELISLKLKCGIIGPVFKGRENTHAADYICRFGEKEYVEVRRMDCFLALMNRLRRDIVLIQILSEIFRSDEILSEVLSRYDLLLYKYYKTIDTLLLRMGPVQLGAGSTKQPTRAELCLAAVVAGFISSFASLDDEDTDPCSLRTFELFLSSCLIQGHGRDIMGWYYPASNLVRFASKPPKRNAVSRRKTFFSCCGELESFLKWWQTKEHEKVHGKGSRADQELSGEPRKGFDSKREKRAEKEDEKVHGKGSRADQELSGEPRKGFDSEREKRADECEKVHGQGKKA